MIESTALLLTDDDFAKYPENRRSTEFSSHYSQNSEDGILEDVFNRIGVSNKYFVEFGAANGDWLSNTAHFRINLGWNGLLMEGDRRKVGKGVKHEWVTSKNINSLFKKYGVPKKFDLLSIDIDSDDYWVWAGLSTEYQPRVVIIETNPGINNKEPVTIEEGKSDVRNGYFGANLNAFYELGKQKGYEFYRTERWNAIFIKQEEFPKLRIEPISKKRCIYDHFKPSSYWAKRIGRKKRWVKL